MADRSPVTIVQRAGQSLFSGSRLPARSHLQAKCPRSPPPIKSCGVLPLPLPVTLFAMLSQPLPHTSARVLEFDSLLELLRGYVSSPLGQKAVAALAPSSDRDWSQHQQQ